MKKFYFIKRISYKEYIMATVGILLGIGGVAFISFLSDQPLMIAPFGASAVLLFGAPLSPFAQPMNFFGSYIVSGLIAITCVIILGDEWYVAPIAVTLAILAMMATDTIHPPGGATALLVALQGTDDYLFIINPVAIGLLILFISAVLSSRIFRGIREYPLSKKRNKIPPLVLASSSPRRKELLEKNNIEFRIEVSNVLENHPLMEPEELVKELSFRKAKEVYERFPNEIILGADTVVSIDGNILEKPVDEADSYNMISTLSGRAHQVYTGVTIYSKDRNVTFVEKTDVYVKKLSEEEIRNYIKTNEGKDKAGSYAIQGEFNKYIEKYVGDYDNVVGLPTGRLIKELSFFS